jgi:hypothetical protein
MKMIINESDRMVLRDYPDTEYAAILRALIAKMKIDRELDRIYIKPFKDSITWVKKTLIFLMKNILKKI